MEKQTDFRNGRSTTDANLAVQKVVEKRWECSLEKHIAFVDYKEALDKVNSHNYMIYCSEEAIQGI